jgi:hypothetical protein
MNPIKRCPLGFMDGTSPGQIQWKIGGTRNDFTFGIQDAKGRCF